MQASAAADAAVGARPVKVGGTGADGLFTVYHQIAKVTVEPAYTIARVGDNGGPLPPVPAQFDAIAWDGDVRIGAVPATFTVDNFDQAAAELHDAKFAGKTSRTVCSCRPAPGRTRSGRSRPTTPATSR